MLVQLQLKSLKEGGLFCAFHSFSNILIVVPCKFHLYQNLCVFLTPYYFKMKLIKYLGFIFIFNACSGPTFLKEISKPKKAEYQLFEDKTVTDIVEPYKSKLVKEMSQVIGKADTILVKARPASLLTNLLADGILTTAQKEASVDMCILNYGGIRLPNIGKGEITTGQIYELLPFDNYLSILSFNKVQLEEFANHIALKGGWPVSKQFNFVIDTAKQIAKNITFNEVALNDTVVYKIVLPDYIANGGDDCSMLANLPRTDLPILLRDAMIDYFLDIKQTVKPVLDKRIKYE